jgi:hypothetical protein
MYREVLLMFDGMSKPTFVVAALVGGLALFVAGFIIAAEMRSVAASPTAATTGGGCYTNWNANTCAAGYTAVETGVWTNVLSMNSAMQSESGGGVICAAEKAQEESGNSFFYHAVTRNMATPPHHLVNLEPCAVCCASGGAAVGGVGQLPNVAGTGDSLPRNQIIIAAVTAMIAFGAGGWYAKRRWLG